jgi:hypothetical protein
LNLSHFDPAKEETVKAARDLAPQLLTRYLAARRRRDVEEELTARFILAEYLTGKKKPDEARKTLSIAHLKPPPNGTDARLLYDTVRRKAAQMKAKPVRTAGS